MTNDILFSTFLKTQYFPDKYDASAPLINIYCLLDDKDPLKHDELSLFNFLGSKFLRGEKMNFTANAAYICAYFKVSVVKDIQVCLKEVLYVPFFQGGYYPFIENSLTIFFQNLRTT